jgi:hypothetical protein
MWLSRLRWRRRGAWMWPAFLVLTVLDGVLVHRQPIAGEGGDLFSSLLLAAFFNLVAVAVVAPLTGALVRRRWRPDWPQVVAHDYAGTALLLAVTAGLLVAGLANRGAVDAEREEFAAQAAAVRAYVGHQAPLAYRRNLRRATTVRLGDDLYRTCVPGPDPQRQLCLFVNTDQRPPGVRRDPNREPNEDFARAQPGP